MNDARAKRVDEYRNVDMVMVYGVVVDTRLVLFFSYFKRIEFQLHFFWNDWLFTFHHLSWASRTV
jgi:hypothetical protein